MYWKKDGFQEFLAFSLINHLHTCLLTFGVNSFNSFQKKINRFLKYSRDKEIKVRDSISILAHVTLTDL